MIVPYSARLRTLDDEYSGHELMRFGGNARDAGDHAAAAEHYLQAAGWFEQRGAATWANRALALAVESEGDEFAARTTLPL